MKITLVVGRASRSMGTFVASLSQELLSQGQDVEVIAEPTTAKQLRLRNALPLWPLRVRRLYLAGSVVRRLRGARQVFAHTEVIHAHGRQATMFTLLMTSFMRNRPPLMVSLYERSREEQDTLRQRVILRWLGHRASLISGSSLRLTAKIDKRVTAADAKVSFLVSPRVKDLVQTPLLDRKQRVANWAELAAEERLSNRGQLVLAIGKIDEEKRFDRFLAAMEKVTYPATAVVIGDGDPQLLAKLRSQGQDAKVYFLGWRHNLETWLAAASVLVVTSQWEPRAFVAQESMAMGLPVVAPAVGRLRDLMVPFAGITGSEKVIADGLNASDEAIGGLVIDPDDAFGTAESITKLLSNPSLWYEKQESARERALTWPDIQDVARDWLDFYFDAQRNARRDFGLNTRKIQ